MFRAKPWMQYDFLGFYEITSSGDISPVNYPPEKI